ncbi:MAG: sugar phosphate isomerase/epimerase family protein [Pirellulales bacterium]
MKNLCVHTITTKPLAIEQAIPEYARRGITGITVWRQAIESLALGQVKHQISDSGLSVVSLCRGGFFPATSIEGRQKAIDDNLLAIEQAAAIGAPLIVLVCGAVPGMPLSEARKRIADGIDAVLPAARAAGVKLAIEPLHPLYADDRSAVNTMKQAHEICDALGSPDSLGIAVDVYHVWWDDDLRNQLMLAGSTGRLLAFHICDWLTPTRDLLNDRGLMGDGCIDIRQISQWVREAGFEGFREVEIFSNRWWAEDQGKFLDAIVERYKQLYPGELSRLEQSR